jgi:hypothetical protein
MDDDDDDDGGDGDKVNYETGRNYSINFHICTVHVDIIKFFYLPTDAQ